MLRSSPCLRGAIPLCLLFSKFRDISSKSRNFELFCRDDHFWLCPQKSILDTKLLPVFEVDIILSSFFQTVPSSLKAELIKHLGGSCGSWWERGVVWRMVTLSFLVQVVHKSRNVLFEAALQLPLGCILETKLHKCGQFWSQVPVSAE